MSSCLFLFCYIEVSLVITAFSRDFPRHYTLSVWLIYPRTTSFSLSCYAFFTLNFIFWILGEFVATAEGQKHPRSFKGFHPQTHTPYVTVRLTVPAPNLPFFLLVSPLFDFLSPSFVPLCSPRRLWNQLNCFQFTTCALSNKNHQISYQDRLLCCSNHIFSQRTYFLKRD